MKGRGLLGGLTGLLLVFWATLVLAQTQSVLPQGMEQFTDGNGAPYAGGKVYLYVPNTSTPKNSWKNPNGTVLNTNPIPLDANGRAIIWGTGLYRQVLRDVLGNLIWDQQTFAPSAAGNQTSSAVCASSNTSGSANAQVLSPVQPVTTLIVGTIYCGVAGLSNTGPATLEVSSTGFFGIKKQSSAGLGNLGGGEIIVGQGYMFMWDGIEYQLLNPETVVGLELSVTSFLPSGQPDGTTDNSVAIAAMVNTICVTNPSGNKVYYPPGHYQIHDVIVPCGISMDGSGASQSGQTTIDYSLGTNYSFGYQPSGWPAVTADKKIFGIRVSDMNFYQSNPAYVGHALVFNGVTNGVVDHISENGYSYNGIRLFGVYKFSLQDVTANYYANVGPGISNNGIELVGDETGQSRAGGACTLGDCSTETNVIGITNYDELGTNTGSCIFINNAVFTVIGNHIECENKFYGLNVGCLAGFANISYCPHFINFFDFESEGAVFQGVNLTDFTEFECTACYIVTAGAVANNALSATLNNYAQAGGGGGGVILDAGHFAASGASVLSVAVSDFKVSNSIIIDGNLSNIGASGLFYNNSRATITNNTFCTYLGAVGSPTMSAVQLGTSALDVIAIGNIFRGCSSGIGGTTGGLTSANNVGP